MEIGKIITINDISVEIILSNTSLKIGDILEVKEIGRASCRERV